MAPKKPLKKMWDKPRKLRVINPSKYEQNEPSVKQYWKNVVQQLELSYKDEKFWESSADQVRKLVSPMVYYRLTQMFGLKPPVERFASDYQVLNSAVSSNLFYVCSRAEITGPSNVRVNPSAEQVSLETEQEEYPGSAESIWSLTTSAQDQNTKTASKPASSASESISRINFSRMNNAKFSMTGLRRLSRPSLPSIFSESAESHDDILVHHGGSQAAEKPTKNPYFKMLYCNESETDMIKWESHYKQKTFEVSASDEFSKKAEIKTKQIAKDFFEWWTNLGTVEFRSEIKRPEDIEGLFQVWFDEHASRGLVVNMREMPCILRHIAEYVRLPEASCDRVLKRQIQFDMTAELEPAHTGAFGSALPHKMKHIPPRNDTVTLWRPVSAPEDLKSMSCVWGEILHLTSTKSFRTWLKQRPHLPMPPVLAAAAGAAGSAAPFVVPSDFVFRTASDATSKQDLALPVSQFNLELKDVLEKVLNE